MAPDYEHKQRLIATVIISLIILVLFIFWLLLTVFNINNSQNSLVSQQDLQSLNNDFQKNFSEARQSIGLSSSTSQLTREVATTTATTTIIEMAPAAAIVAASTTTVIATTTATTTNFGPAVMETMPTYSAPGELTPHLLPVNQPSVLPKL